MKSVLAPLSLCQNYHTCEKHFVRESTAAKTMRNEVLLLLLSDVDAFVRLSWRKSHTELDTDPPSGVPAGWCRECDQTSSVNVENPANRCCPGEEALPGAAHRGRRASGQTRPSPCPRRAAWCPAAGRASERASCKAKMYFAEPQP